MATGSDRTGRAGAQGTGRERQRWRAERHAARVSQHVEEAQQLLVQAAGSGDTVIMERLAARFDEAGRGKEAEEWLRRAAEAGDSIVMQQLADRLDEAGRAEEAEMWLRQAAEADGPFSHFVRLRLAQRLDDTGRPGEAEEWLRRDIEAGGMSGTKRNQ